MEKVHNVYQLVKFLDDNYSTGSSFDYNNSRLICMGSNFDTIRALVLEWCFDHGFNKPSGYDFYIKGDIKVSIYKVPTGIRLEIDTK